MNTPFPAPSFALQDQAGAQRTLTEFRGNWLVLFFYPKDFTPGCTIEVCNLRDGRDEIVEQTGAQLVGISRDDGASHQDFIKEHKLTFPLLSDPDADIIKQYEAEDSVIYDGKNGVLRKTFLIDPEGQVRKVYDDVTPEGHAAEILKDLRELIEV